MSKTGYVLLPVRTSDDPRIEEFEFDNGETYFEYLGGGQVLFIEAGNLYEAVKELAERPIKYELLSEEEAAEDAAMEEEA